MIGISIKPTIGIGDGLQYSSLPENYFRAKGQKMYDISKPWFFDYNPYVSRDPSIQPSPFRELWNFSPTQYQWPDPRLVLPRKGDHNPPEQRPKVYLSNAEIWASLYDIKPVLIRPRLYRYEDFPFEQRKMILLQTEGRSHGALPKKIADHVVNKYKATGQLFHIGPGETYGLPHIETPTLWELAKLISEASMLIGVDSAPSWIAACYPDVIVKKVRIKPQPDLFQEWIPLEIKNIHSHWDDRCHQIYNTSEDDIGFTQSYKKM